jgi:hypothetical protein
MAIGTHVVAETFVGVAVSYRRRHTSRDNIHSVQATDENQRGDYIRNSRVIFRSFFSVFLRLCEVD